MFNSLFSIFSNDIGIDLGTANTLVYVAGRGIVINEPSVVAVNQKTGKVVAVGSDAKRMVGRTPSHIVAHRPLIEGVISDFEITEEMIMHFIHKVHGSYVRRLARPRVVIGVPSGITEVKRKAVIDAAKSAGARQVFLIDEPMAAAIGVRLEVQEPVGNMIVDIGGGTSDIAVISLGGIVASKNLRVAEDLKIAIGSAVTQSEELEATMRGRDLISGLPREVLVTDADVREALKNSVHALVKSVKETIEVTPPELVADIIHRGIVLVGGGSQLRGLDILFERETRIPVHVADDPVTAVVRGTGIVLEDIDHLKNVLIDETSEEVSFT